MSGRTTKRCPSSFHVGERLLSTDHFGFSAKDGLQSWCKDCKRAAYLTKSAEILTLHASRYRKDADFRERKKAITRRWARENADRDRENTLRWRRRYPDRVQRINATFRERNRDRLKDYRCLHNWLYRTRKSLAGGNATEEKIHQRWNYYGGKCWMCGSSAKEMDHVKPVSKGGGSWASNLRPACTPCNRRKRNVWPWPMR